VIVTGKGVRGVMRMIARGATARAGRLSRAVSVQSLAVFAAGGDERREARVLHGYPVGYWRAMHFLPSTRVPAVRGIHDVEQNLRCSSHSASSRSHNQHGRCFL
jgi:hypothetical protein